MSIDVEAAPELVFRLAEGVERWERLLPHYARSRVIRQRADGARVVAFVARRPVASVIGLGLPVAWRARTWADPDALRLHFVHVAGPTTGMEVVWRIEPIGPGTRVSIDHDFRSPVPGLASFIDRVFTRAIAGRTLATFKALAEALAEPSTS